MRTVDVDVDTPVDFAVFVVDVGVLMLAVIFAPNYC